jgi:hypothetical protein
MPRGRKVLVVDGAASQASPTGETRRAASNDAPMQLDDLTRTPAVPRAPLVCVALAVHPSLKCLGEGLTAPVAQVQGAALAPTSPFQRAAATDTPRTRAGVVQPAVFYYGPGISPQAPSFSFRGRTDRLASSTHGDAATGKRRATDTEVRLRTLRSVRALAHTPMTLARMHRRVSPSGVRCRPWTRAPSRLRT